MTRGRRLAGRVLGVIVCVAVAQPLTGSWTAAADVNGGRIVSNVREDSTLNLVFQADGLPAGTTIDPESVVVTVDGETVTSEASDAGSGVIGTRRAILAIDTSHSMAAGGKIDAAKAAATTFLDALDGYEVGLVTFADSAAVALPPTDDRGLVGNAIEQLSTSDALGTALFDGIAAAIDQTSGADSTSVLVLSDGKQFGPTTATNESVVDKATAAHVAIDSVYIGGGAIPPSLTSLASETNGKVVTAGTADLAQVFEQKAADISSRMIVTAQLPADVGQSAQVLVSANAGGTAVSGSVTNFAAASEASPTAIAGPTPVEAASSLFDSATLPYLLAAFFLGLLIIVYVALGTVKRDEKSGRVRRRLSIYTLTGRAPVKQEETTTTALGSSQVARSAVELAGKVVDKRDFEAALALRLEAAGVPLRAAEWMLIHLAVAIGSALVLLLVSGGKIFPTVLGLAAGLGLPWAYLLVKESRRTTAFLAQLPDTLQLIAGSLSAGYSMPQAMDTVVREGSQPVTGEFNRALVEARLGVPMEDAMEGIADRMKSKDFAWVVMAIRIQREVGGNLAELLTTVSDTLRERETLRRQVKVLSAEGRLSAWILGLLPPVFALYLALAQPSYLEPLVSEPLGWLLLGVGTVLLAVGALWMRKAVKVEV
jgi:tight adherence protein B